MVCFCRGSGIKDTKEKLKMAPDAVVKLYSEEVEKVLMALGYPSAVVTDESRISTFIDNTNKTIEEVSEQLGVLISGNDYIYEVAMRIALKAGEL